MSSVRSARASRFLIAMAGCSGLVFAGVAFAQEVLPGIVLAEFSRCNKQLVCKNRTQGQAVQCIETDNYCKWDSENAVDICQHNELKNCVGTSV